MDTLERKIYIDVMKKALVAVARGYEGGIASVEDAQEIALDALSDALKMEFEDSVEYLCDNIEWEDVKDDRIREALGWGKVDYPDDQFMYDN